jgi:hypothetical protein
MEEEINKLKSIERVLALRLVRNKKQYKMITVPEDRLKEILDKLKEVIKSLEAKNVKRENITGLDIR